MNSIYDYSKEKLTEIFLENNISKFRATQVIEWLYRKQVSSFDEMNNVDSKTIAFLKENFTFNVLETVTVQKSSDGTQKFLFKLEDGAFIETVLMAQTYGNSVCVSTQVGCNMGCMFCASGKTKKIRNLRTSEIVMQVLAIDKALKVEDKRVSHVVVMGIGEPFDNYDNLLEFLRIINDPKGLEIGARHITVSTCGLVPKIKEFANFPLQINLAVSLHFPNDELRSQYMLINRKYHIGEVIEALKYYFEVTNRRLTFEYILLDGINDSKECALELCDLIGGLNAYVNLIPYNDTLDFKRSSKENILRFYDILKKHGINVTLRKEMGTDILAACGQLRVNKMEGKCQKD